MNNTEMKRMVVRASVFTVLSIAVMLHRSATKHIMITDAAGTYVDRGSGDDSYNLLISTDTSAGGAGKLIIPLPKTVSSDNIVLEDKYVDHELCIYVDSREEGFYKDNAITTDLDILESAVCITQNDTGSVCLDFKLDSLYASESTLTDNSTIEVTFSKPSDKYDHIVVVDAASDKDIPLDIVLSLKELTDRIDDPSTKFYFTRLDGRNIDDEKRLALINDSGADLVVKIDTDVSTDKSVNGIYVYYNGVFFIRNLNNAQFADLLLQNCGKRTENSMLGMFESDETDLLLSRSTVPTARISAGYISGNEDYGKMTDPTYCKRMAEGIFEAIKAGFAELGK
ncbi:N-acetylmuramoyl-L-alanine amidase family protein [Butyrivibrio proteoclasticus]|uniref:N-acetylmuramoyl-L-alanine amidase family protein n=1 Tax=Butyrivibrio proteoclasticus TaxID=43305 RepID=UPI000479FA97|nr:N-acetylmuramoyl-L-alanine amidase [Butyrivibrio proteoclasticus]